MCVFSSVALLDIGQDLTEVMPCRLEFKKMLLDNMYIHLVYSIETPQYQQAWDAWLGITIDRLLFQCCVANCSIKSSRQIFHISPHIVGLYC